MTSSRRGGGVSNSDPFARLSVGDCALLRRAELPRVVVPMKAVLTKDGFSDDRWIFERKLDGIRCIATKDGPRVRLATRNDLSLSERFPELVDAVETARGSQLIVDGEIVA